MKDTRAVREYVATKRAAEEVVAMRASLQKITAERDDLAERLAKAEAANEPGAWEKERAALTAQIEALKQDVALAQTLARKSKSPPTVAAKSGIEAQDPKVRALDRDVIARLGR